MKQCIIADFEWCVTPYPIGNRFQYFNEILSVGAVQIDETGCILNSFYTLIRPMYPEYLHPVILNALHLQREELAVAPQFETVFADFCAFACNPDNSSPAICTWGCADRAALLQNVRVKGGFSAEDAAQTVPPMRDLQPAVCRAAEIRQPYPSLASLLSRLHLDLCDDNSHNALSDARGTARILAHFAQQTPSRAWILPLFSDLQVPSECPTAPDLPPITTDTQPMDAETYFRTPGEAINNIRSSSVPCPVCGATMGCGTWLRVTHSEAFSICTCELDGKFLCTLKASEVADAEPGDNRVPMYHATRTLHPYIGTYKKKYEAARHMIRTRRR